MLYYELAKRLFLALILLILVSLLFTKWDSIQLIIWGPPEAQELDFNENSKLSRSRPIIISPR